MVLFCRTFLSKDELAPTMPVAIAERETETETVRKRVENANGSVPGIIVLTVGGRLIAFRHGQKIAVPYPGAIYHVMNRGDRRAFADGDLDAPQPAAILAAARNLTMKWKNTIILGTDLFKTRSRS